MNKFYVESGPCFRFVVLAETHVDAIVKSLDLVPPTAPLHLADVFIVNERGFVWEREKHQLHGDELVVPTELLLELPESNER